MTSFDVVYEDNHLLVVDKPAGLATMVGPDGDRRPTLHHAACDYLRRKYQKPGRVYLGLVSRLDAVTSGAIVLARTSKSASRLAPQFGGVGKPIGGEAKPFRAVKVYLALVSGQIGDPGTPSLATPIRWVDHVRKDDAARRMRCHRQPVPGSDEAILDWLPVARTDAATLVAVRLITGRKHQIRVQFAHRGFSILGDQKYGSDVSFGEGIGLHSWRLRLQHPTLRDQRWFHVNPPARWGRVVRDHALADRIARIEEIWPRIAHAFEVANGEGS